MTANNQYIVPVLKNVPKGATHYRLAGDGQVFYFRKESIFWHYRRQLPGMVNYWVEYGTIEPIGVKKIPLIESYHHDQ